MNRPNYNKAISYKDRDIGTIYLTGGGFIDRPFKGIGTDSKFGWSEMVWYKTPSRSQSFDFQNMDDIDVGLIARCEINMKYMNIHDYMDLRKILGRERFFYATFFDMDEGKWVTREMYCSENTVTRFFTLKQSLVGAFDYNITLVGTNRDLIEDGTITKTYHLTYNSNGGTGSVDAVDFSWGDQVQIDDATSIASPDGVKTFQYWEARESQTDGTYIVIGRYRANQSTTLWHDLNLYAIWE